MVLAKSKNAVGLGNSLMNDRFGKGKGADMRRGNAVAGGITRKGQNGETYVTNNKKDAAYMKMRSVTEQAALDEFLSTAELAGTDFTAEKMNNVKIIHADQRNPYLLTATEERAAVTKQDKNRKRLTVPRRPPWDETTSRQDLDQREKEALIDWRRGLAEMQENDDLLMTPFERNLEVWRQLWRVIERSDLVVQIVDARNPLLYRCEDLERYVDELGNNKRNLLLVNKADMMTLAQRQAWAAYFVREKIAFRFFSAELAKEQNEAGENTDSDTEDDHVQAPPVELANEPKPRSHSDQPLSLDDQVHILTTDELESLFLAHTPTIDTDDPAQADRKTQIGLVGYPNVGKSSSINALLGAKKVSVSATPGKTKHFQTIHLSDRVILCDCPGLVFPNFATTKAELVCNGILPIDQLREYTGPAQLVGARIPQAFLEAIYGMKIHTRPIEEGGTGIPTGAEVLRAYASARGFSTQGLGQPDESRAARYVLKDYVKGKLLFCHPPPADPLIDPRVFNRELYDVEHLPERRRKALAIDELERLTMMDDDDDADTASVMDDETHASRQILQQHRPPPTKSENLDKTFFAGNGAGTGMTRPFHQKYTAQGQRETDEATELNGGKQLSGRKARLIVALEKGMGADEAREAMVVGSSSKRHYKANKKAAKKVRNEYE